MIGLNLAATGLGLVLGSFILTMAMRLQSGESLWKRSKCDHCQDPIGVIGLIPILGYALQKGRCASCGEPISRIYPVVEILNAVIVWLVFSKTGLTLAFIHMLVISQLFLLIAVIDFRTRLIFPQPIVLGLAAQSIWLAFFDQASVLNALLGLFIGAGLFHWIAYLYYLVRQREGLGAGDATLLGLIGFIFGWQILFSIIFWASILGIVIGGTTLLINRQSFKESIAFAPWLVLSALLVWRFSDWTKGFLFDLSFIDIFTR